MSNLDAQIRTFLAVARLGSFRLAAEELYVTQAAVTTRIKTLETWLGFEVFMRHRRGVDLTPQGVRFIEYARTAVDIIELGKTRSASHWQLSGPLPLYESISSSGKFLS